MRSTTVALRLMPAIRGLLAIGERPLGVLGRVPRGSFRDSLCRKEKSWEVFIGPWEILGQILEVSGSAVGVLEGPWGVLGDPWGVLGWPLDPCERQGRALEVLWRRRGLGFCFGWTTRPNGEPGGARRCPRGTVESLETPCLGREKGILG